MLSVSRRNCGESFGGSAYPKTLSKVACHVANEPEYAIERAAVKRGNIEATTGRVVDVQSRVDTWARRYGPDVPVTSAINWDRERQNRQRQQPNSGGGGSGQGQSQQQQQPGGSSNNSSQPAGQQQGSQPQSPDDAQPTQTQTTGPASGQETNQPQPVPPKPQPSPEQQALKAAQQAYRDALARAKQAPQSSGSASVSAAKRNLQMARRKASHNRVAQASAPSLVARKTIAGAHGRLQRVPPKLRQQVADLINRLVDRGGSAGENFAPIPVLSARKLVQRMVVRRPLPNALKEDSMTGRPCVLFLPDVSPSCEAQAQIACDLANAAGYAGVSGSDVLVFPHSNGEVDSTENYIPWFNGKPVATDPGQVERLFDQVCGGQSCYRVRVVVFIGDHDATEQYRKVIGLKSVTRAIWLHNYFSGKYAVPETVESGMIPDWNPELLSKLSMVQGCTNLPTMLKGFKIALAT
jgi:hypothetical protein